MLAVSEEQDRSTDFQRSILLPRPPIGGASRIRFGGAELVLEHSRGSYCLLWSDGKQAQRYVLGLGVRGEVAAELRAPRLPVRVLLREVLTLVPGGRMHGYITVPLVPTIVLRDGPRIVPLLELHPPTLRGEWHEQGGHVYRCGASWLVRFPLAVDEPRAVVPLRLCNRSAQVISPPHVDLQFCDHDLHELRGSLVLRPQRLAYGLGKVQGDEDEARGWR